MNETRPFYNALFSALFRSCHQPHTAHSQDFVRGVAFLGGLYTKLISIDRKLLGPQMVLGLRFGAGAEASGAGAGAPAVPALATGLVVS